MIDGIDTDEFLADFRLAHTARAIDDREIILQKQSKVYFQISSAGHEALGVGLARSLRAGHDWFFPYYRDLAIVLGLGVTPFAVLAQAVGSAADPSSGGRQMPSHWGSKEHHIVSQSSSTGSQCLPAVGCAEAGRYLARTPDLDHLPAASDEVVYVSLGDGATSEGEFWEALNTATNERLPVLFAVADNGYAISVPTDQQAPATIDALVGGFPGLHVANVDGTDYPAVRRTGAAVVEHLRDGLGPVLLRATVTRPYSHSSADTQAKYRPEKELAEEARRDPLVRMGVALSDAGVLSPAEQEALIEEVRAEVAAVAKDALAAPRPDPAAITDHVVAIPDLPDPGEPVAPPGAASVPLGAAISAVLEEQMARDPRIRVFGEDVADAPDAILDQVEGKGGVFGTTAGLQRRFGSDRCFNSPLAEANIIGRAHGHGLRGLRPTPEIQFFDYIWPAMNQLRSEAATLRWRSHGAFSCPMVLRVAIGGYLTGGAIWHSQSGVSFFAHVPGLLIAFPSRAADAAGLLRAAFAHEDPVLFLEHKHLLRQSYTADPLPGPDYVLPFGRGAIRRPGDACTVVTWGATVHKSLLAAETVAARGLGEVEVLDLRTIAPWDQDLVAESVQRTGRVLVVHEDTLTCGFGAELAAWIGEHCFFSLDAPVRRVAALDTHVPYEPTLERAVLPQVEDVEAALAELLRA